MKRTIRNLSPRSEKSFLASLEPKTPYFDLQAFLGATKHLGGLKATRELVELCGIEQAELVLEVGCGVGKISLWLGKNYPPEIIALDISQPMLTRARKNLSQAKLTEKIQLVLADAQALPFQKEIFDLVLCESVNSFIQDKPEALKEYFRVLKPGGYLAINEPIWIKEPSPKLVEYFKKVTGVREILNSGQWCQLLEQAGFSSPSVRAYRVRAINQFFYEIQQTGIKDYLSGWARFFLLLFSSPEFRSYLKTSLPPKEAWRGYFRFLGYGLFIARKEN